MLEPTTVDLRALSLEQTLAAIRAELCRLDPVDRLEALMSVVEARLRELRAELAETPDLADPVSVAVHVGEGAVAVEILAGPSRDWIHQS